ncbi:MAG: hypothetical protein J0I06_03530 [Planctomycetes bacterium]|nr:hypothetical protein [Planctomycetota bacterium]
MRSLTASFRTFSIGSVAVICLASALGCSTGRKYEGASFPVEGALRWKDGSDAGDLGGGTLELESAAKSVIKIPIAADGTFTRDERLPAGKYRARVSAPPPRPDDEYDMDAKFQKFETSGLTVTVGDEEQQRISLTLTRTAKKNRQ